MLGVSEHVVRTNMANRFNWLDDEQTPISMGWNGMEWGSRWHQSVMQHPQCRFPSSCRFRLGLPWKSHRRWPVNAMQQQTLLGKHASLQAQPLEFHGIPPWNPLSHDTLSCKASDIVGSTKEVGNVTFLQSKFLRIFLWILSKFEYVDVCIYYNIYIYICLFVYLFSIYIHTYIDT